MKKVIGLLFLVLFIVSCNNPQSGSDQKDTTSYDVVISSVRVIDPETNTDSILNIGISNGTIQKLTAGTLTGKRSIDGTGKIACPGFIDLHTHSPFPYGEALQVQDGATTILDLEAGAFPTNAYGEFFEKGARANFGASVGHYAIRIKVMEKKDQPYLVTHDGGIVPGAAFTKKASPAQIEEMRLLLEKGIDDGGLGIGLLLDYMSSAVSDSELRMIFEVAKKKNAVVWAHIRRGVNGDIQGLNDVLKLSQEIGTALHICHINANAMGEIGNWLKAIDNANAKGANITAEIFPYTAGSTNISADVFNRDWQKIFNITYKDVQWSETGEWFTKESWEEKRKTRPDSYIIHHYMKEEWIKEGLRYPKMMIASDATPAASEKVKGNPNISACYTRLLSTYVRDEKVLSLNDAIAKSSYYPAKRLELNAPLFKKKGRIQEGADADILVFALENLKANATYTEPFKPSSGWDYVFVGGNIVVDMGKLNDATPGKRVLAR